LNEPAADTLAAALARHGIALPAEQVALLDRYRELLWEWNERMNLTRHTDFERFVARDVVDSIELSKLLASGESLLDFGTGGGVPGVIVAIVRPDVRVSVCESVGKKAKAVEAIIKELGIKVPVYGVRAEQVLAKTTLRRARRSSGRLAGRYSEVAGAPLDLDRSALVGKGAQVG
jgi:16S rRNA (guanine527-N7)-methyltransferase